MSLVLPVTGTGGNPSTSPLDLPEYIISTFIPGAAPLLTRYPRLFRFLGVLVALYYFSPLYRLTTLWTQFSSFFTSTVTVASDEDLFGYLVTFLYAPPKSTLTIRPNTSLIASIGDGHILPSSYHRRHDPYEDDIPNLSRKTVPKIKYEQSQGLQLFTQNRRLFFITRGNGEGHTYYDGKSRHMELLHLSCLGRSTQPIKDFLEDVYKAHKATEQSMTIIRRPYNSGGYHRLAWSKVTAKPKRDLSTVILDIGQKALVVADVDEYMSESTQSFYANHGIPYRRGYLFYGPPGVGKTSFALALAARFELDVYVLTLLDRDLGDAELLSLLNQLPARSLLLLEDIDTAGLNRKAPIKPRRRCDALGPEGRIGEVADLGALANDPQAGNASDDSGDDNKTPEQRSRVSLSGLLNAIDGVAAPEGHVLIMTTNKPDELDEALVRAGRISVKVPFRNATKAQAEEIFRKMFTDPVSVAAEGAVGSSSGSKSSANDTLTTDNKIEFSPSLARAPPTPISPILIPTLAQDFASKLADHEFSPADLQDYLLVRKKEPLRAVADVEMWRQEYLEEMERREEQKVAEKERKEKKKKKKAREFREEMRRAVVEAGATGGKNGDEGRQVEDRTEVEENVDELGGVGMERPAKEDGADGSAERGGNVGDGDGTKGVRDQNVEEEVVDEV